MSIDDFGTGHSSLSYLQRFPFDTLKIDASFVRGIDRDVRRRAIVESVIGLADKLGLTTTAEGVETASELDVLRHLGCRRAQGFLIAPALDPETLTDLVMGDPRG